MREIKFRAVYNGELLDRVFKPFDLYDELTKPCNHDEGEYTKEGLLFEQYTGLKDKNGREIYEGDILELEESMGMGRIRKRKDVVTFDDDVVDEYGACIAGWFVGESRDKRLVVGNIHENPELLT